MRISELTVGHYRGWREPVSWHPSRHALVVGPNNAGKTTLLTAADLVLDPYRDRYRDRLEVWDYPDCDTSQPVEITVILADLSDEDRDHFEPYLEGRREDGTFGGWDSPEEEFDQAELVLRLKFRGAYGEPARAFFARPEANDAPVGQADKIHIGWQYIPASLDPGRELYQDSSPLQAAIVTRLTGQGSRVYAFADPLQQIYEWRDASKQRLDEFRASRGPSEHILRTLHRYRHRPALQVWMQHVRDVLLDDAASVTVIRPPEIHVVYYDPNQPEKGKVWGAATRELWQIDEPIAKALRSREARTIGVIARRRDQLTVLERHLTKRFRCGRLRASEDALDLAIEWVDGYASAITVEHHTHRLLTLAKAVAPRHQHLDFAARVGPDGIDPARLREPRRGLAESITELAHRCDTLPGAFRAVHDLTRLVCEGQDPRVIDWDCLYAIRRVLHAQPHLSHTEAAERAHARVRQARFGSAPSPRRGIYLLSCHEGKGKEFDFVVLPYVADTNFEDDEESRQLLYVSLSRARRWILVRLASGRVPPICKRLGLA
jgi:hypothetical protein